MIPLNKVREIISKHKNLEQELSSGEVKKEAELLIKKYET